MNSEKIIIELSKISTPTGITCCGDITLDDSTCDEIIEYIQNLEQALNEIKEYIITKKITKDGVFLVKESTFGQDILQIIDNVLGDEK